MFLLLMLTDPTLVTHLIIFFSLILGNVFTLGGIIVGVCALSKPGKLRWRIYPFWPATCLAACIYTYFTYLQPMRDVSIIGYYTNVTLMSFIVFMAVFNLVEVLIRYAINARRNDWSGRGMPVPPIIKAYRALINNHR